MMLKPLAKQVNYWTFTIIRKIYLIIINPKITIKSYIVISKLNGGIMDIVNLALQIATKAHANQLDKGGAQYIEHPKFVASLLTSPEEKATTLLHDVVEEKYSADYFSSY